MLESGQRDTENTVEFHTLARTQFFSEFFMQLQEIVNHQFDTREDTKGNRVAALVYIVPLPLRDARWSKSGGLSSGPGAERVDTMAQDRNVTVTFKPP